MIAHSACQQPQAMTMGDQNEKTKAHCGFLLTESRQKNLLK
jgi:hypothetical protein